MIESVKMFAAHCDGEGCKESFETFGGYGALHDKEEIQDEICDSSEWSLLNDGRVYCPKCHNLSLNESNELCSYTKKGEFLGVNAI